MKWYHFSFKKKKKKKQANQTTCVISKYAYLGATWGGVTPPQPPQLESLGKCEICGNDIYTIIHECELCGKKTCDACMMVLTQFTQTIHFSGSTVWTTTPYFAPTPLRPKTKPHDLKICVSCADLLKLSLRIASIGGVIEKDEDQF